MLVLSVELLTWIRAVTAQTYTTFNMTTRSSTEKPVFTLAEVIIVVK